MPPLIFLGLTFSPHLTFNFNDPLIVKFHEFCVEMHCSAKKPHIGGFAVAGQIAVLYLEKLVESYYFVIGVKMVTGMTGGKP
jgi:hypothetical protein